MPKKLASSSYLSANYFPVVANVSTRLNRVGQTLVEFALVFVLFVVVAWIPADFGLAFYTGQIALNASREGARIAAAERNVVSANCTMPCAGATGLLKAAADHMSSALLPGAIVSVALDPGTTCDRMVTVTISGQYRYFFYNLLKLMGVNVLNPVPVVRSTSMRWEHQC
jgi:hypothetical protein